MTDELLREDTIKICPVCGGEFIVSQKQFIYCSERCRKNASSKKKLKSKSKVKTCGGCGKLFQTNRYNPKQRYCSHECYYRSVMKTTKPQEEPKEHTEPKRVICTKCGSPFKTSRNTTLCPLCRELR